MFTLGRGTYKPYNGLAMGSVDPAFKPIDKDRSAFHIWRIEKMQVVAVPKDFYGQFYRGDSYIILSVTAIGQSPKGKDMQIRDMKGSPVESHIHFWLGSETSQDEAGIAAYKSVELDDYLGGSPVQHRETEGFESPVFLSYFPKGIQIMEGGASSGFRHVEKVFKVRMLHIKGKRIPRIMEVRVPISWENMNSGDCFVLDIGNLMFVWIGKECRRSERLKAMEVSRQLRDERGGKASLIVVEDGEEEAMKGDVKKAFEQHLALKDKSGKIKSKEQAGEDEKIETTQAGQLKLYSCSEESGTLKISEVKSGPLSRKDLTSQDAFIVDRGGVAIWVWIGKKASPREKKEAMRNGLGFISKKQYNKSTPVTRVIDGGEPVDFKCLFKDWPQPTPPGKVYTNSRIAKTVQTKFDAATLHSNHALAAETQMVDDGSGKVEVWRVDNFELHEVPSAHHGEFFGGDCYVIQYTYKVNKRENYIVYFWLGLHSTADEKGTAALKAVELDDKVGGSAVQVRVVQYKEPPHFMSMFGGMMVIFEGGKAGWAGGDEKNGPGDRYMLHVRGTTKLNTKAVQVPMRASSLNSNDVFVIFTKSSVFLWAGKGCTGDEREMAKVVASKSPRTVTMVFEGKEKEDFWNVFDGGKEPYASDKRLQEDANCAHAPRLFQLSNAAGRFSVEEIPDFVQTDLIEEDIMILDVWDQIYIWVGKGSNKDERAEADRMAKEYLATDPAGRDTDTPICRIKQGFEPPSFTGFFGVWDTDLWNKGKTYEQMKEELGSDAVSFSLVQDAVNGSAPSFNEVSKFPYEQLTVDVEDLPPGVNAEAREVHLEQEEFMRLFKMSYESFMRKPAWKQVQIKKELKLF
ncbi:advillin-like isoform X3 [Gigantopelta aegis]|uniref:advillin-like isoform X3 n=1 Tax=Gigantopelta aegis TaxID=1735272 RepID=UPI001B88847A|nr:advillin-like isoform X3 [Gigantopelta aegis]